MALKSNTAEGQADGTTLTAANSGGGSGDAFTTVIPGSSGAIKFSNTHPAHGSMGYSFLQPTTTNACYVDFTDGTPAATFAARIYLYITVLPDAAVQFPIAVRNSSSGALGRLNMNTSGQLTISVGAVTSSASAALSINTLYRVELTGTGFNSAATAMTCHVYSGDSNTVVATCSASGATTAALVDLVRIGKASGASGVQFYVDDAAANVGTSTEIGAVATPITYSISDNVTLSDAGVSPSLLADFTDTVGVGDGLALAQYTAVVPPVDVLVEMLAGTEWVDLSGPGYLRDGEAVIITRGRRGEGSAMDTASCAMTFDNTGGDFSPRNPEGRWYGRIGRNTQTRESVPARSGWMDVPNASSTVPAYASTPDTAALDITGDIDLRVDVWPSSWRIGQRWELEGKWTRPDQRSYVLTAEPGGFLQLWWSPDGTSYTTATSTLPVPAPIYRRAAVRATLDVNNGSGGWTARFYTAATLAGSWTQLGDPVTGAGVTSIFNSTTPLYVGNIQAGGALTTYQPAARWYGAEVRNGIGGTIVANPDFTLQAHGANSLVDSTNKTWTLTGCRVVRRRYRHHGEISEWPVRSDTTGHDVYIPVVSSGITRRLSKSTSSARSAFYRACTSVVPSVPSLQAYWSCEDGQNATEAASGLPGQPPMRVTGTASWAADSTSFPCSDPLPKPGPASLEGSVTTYASTGAIQLGFLLAVPAAGIVDGTVIASLRCTGTAARWDLVYGTASGGTLSVKAYDAAGGSLLTSSSAVFALNGSRQRLALSLATVGPTVEWTASGLTPGATTAVTLSGTLAGRTVGRANVVMIGSGLTDCTVGHVTVQSAVSDPDADAALVNAYSGETASARFARLCAEQGIPCVVLGEDPTETPLGYQTKQPILALLQEVETADQGMIFEPAEFFGLGYRTARSLMLQAATLTLDYAARHLSVMDSTEDDRNTVNDVTVARAGGSSARATVTSGPLSVQDPPDGVGAYPAGPTVSAASDSQLPGMASWRTHLGTVDEPRFTDIGANLRNAIYGADPDLADAVMALDLGDRVVLQNPPAWFPAGDISQLAIGTIERLSAVTHTLDIVGQPETPYRAGVWGVSRWSPAGCTVAGNHTAGATSILVDMAGGILWGHNDGDYLVTLGTGEECLVTGVSGTGPQQTLTVTRAVNGISKPLAGGESVDLSDRRFWVP